MLEERDYTLIIDRSGSMALKDQAGGRTRWAVARERTSGSPRSCSGPSTTERHREDL
jgi:hypothetical protein